LALARVALRLLRAAEHLPAHRRDARPRPAVSLVRATSVTGMTEVVMIAGPRVTIATSVLAPVELNATLAPPAARVRNVAQPNLAIVGRPATATTLVSAVLVMSAAPVEAAKAENLRAVPATIASLATIAGVTAPSARPAAAMIARAPIVFATTVRARIAHAMTAVPRLAPIVTSAAPRGSTATTAHEPTVRAPIVLKATALSVAAAMTARAPIVFVMTATRAPVAVTATIATSARAASSCGCALPRPPAMALRPLPKASSPWQRPIT
jgi:hypothetical protein